MQSNFRPLYQLHRPYPLLSSLHTILQSANPSDVGIVRLQLHLAHNSRAAHKTPVSDRSSVLEPRRAEEFLTTATPGSQWLLLPLDCGYCPVSFTSCIRTDLQPQHPYEILPFFREAPNGRSSILFMALKLRKYCIVGGNAVSAFLSWRLQATNACDVTLVWKSGFESVSQYGISFK